MKAAIYTRTSTLLQNSENQIKQCKRILKPEDELVKIYSDHGFSGLDDNRPSLVNLMKDANNKIFDHLIIYSYDRLFRNEDNMKEFLRGLDQLEIKLVVIDQL
jgi:DNA invertase Pin-like site-specific DNA recombinase